jgi:hypothetical protein
MMLLKDKNGQYLNFHDRVRDDEDAMFGTVKEMYPQEGLVLVQWEAGGETEVPAEDLTIVARFDNEAQHARHLATCLVEVLQGQIDDLEADLEAMMSEPTNPLDPLLEFPMIRQQLTNVHKLLMGLKIPYKPV